MSLESSPFWELAVRNIPGAGALTAFMGGIDLPVVGQESITLPVAATMLGLATSELQKYLQHPALPPIPDNRFSVDVAWGEGWVLVGTSTICSQHLGANGLSSSYELRLIKRYSRYKYAEVLRIDCTNPHPGDNAVWSFADTTWAGVRLLLNIDTSELQLPPPPEPVVVAAVAATAYYYDKVAEETL